MREIKSMTTTGGFLIVQCEDGTWWMKTIGKNDWSEPWVQVPIPEIPEGEEK